MDLVTNYDSDPQRLPRLTREEQRIADAIVAALSPQLQNIDRRLGNIETRLDGVETRLDGVETRLVGVETRLDGVEGSISQQTALIQANHEDIISLQQQMADFREEQNEAWAVNGEVWNRLDANVQLLMDERN